MGLISFHQEVNNMQFDGALLRIHRIQLAIVIVKPHVLNNSNCEQVRTLVSNLIPYRHIIFLSKNNQGKPVYHGRRDIALFLSKINPYKIPFKTFNF